MDIVFVDSLQLSANIGPDCWGRTRAQPVIVSIYLHLSTGYLTCAGETDDVKDSVHYGHLCKAVIKRVGDSSFSNVKNLIAAVTEEAFELGGEAVAEVKVRVEMSKMILLAGGFSAEVITPAKTATADVPMIVTVSDLTLATIIGVNAPEREAKQRVVTDINFTERGGTNSSVDYQKMVAEIAKNIEESSYFTLEKLVLEVVRTVRSEAIESVTVSAKKPSALTFSRYSGVQITRLFHVF